MDPAFAHGVGYFVRYPGLYAMRARTGERLWSFTAGGPFITPPLIVGRVVYVGAQDGRVYGLDARSGALRWRRKTAATFAGDNTSSLGQPTDGLGASGRLLVVPNAKGVVVSRGRR